MLKDVGMVASAKKVKKQDCNNLSALWVQLVGVVVVGRVVGGGSGRRKTATSLLTNYLEFRVHVTTKINCVQTRDNCMQQ